MRNTKQINKLKNKASGITLIALVITIIVLLILAGISIMMLTGENSILNRAGQAKEDTVVGQEKEAIAVAYNGVLTNTQGAGVGADDLQEELRNNGNKNATAVSKDDKIEVTFETGHVYIVGEDGSINEYKIPLAGMPVENPESYGDNAQATADGEGKFFALPTNAIYVEGTVDTGVVIKYKDSEFVWVPVPNAIYDGTSTLPTTSTTASSSLYTPMATTYEYNDNTYYRGMLYSFEAATENEETATKVKCESSWEPGSTNYREPSLVTGNSDDRYAPMTSVSGTSSSSDVGRYSDAGTFTSVTDFGSTMQSDYDKMVESVAKYGGFYVGRYESSIDGETVASIKNVAPASAKADSANRWYGLYNRQKKFSPESETNNSMVSSMIWGSQYDAMLNWALTGADKDKVTSTGNALHTGLNKADLKTGTTTENDSLTDKIDRINNIYDLEGNLCEWTLEAFDYGTRIGRGGDYLNSKSPSGRVNSVYSYGTYSSYGSRLSLYIK